MKLKMMERIAVSHGAAAPRGNCGSFHGKNVVAMLSIKFVYVCWLLPILFW